MSETNGVGNRVAAPVNRLHDRMNPWAKRENHSDGTVTAFKVLTALSWLVLVVFSILYTFSPPGEGKWPRRTIWGQNSAHPTGFSLNSIIVSIYWIVLFILQIGYCWHLYANNKEYVNAAANVGSHFIINNLLMFGFIHLWVRSHFWLAELLLIVNLFNLTSGYFRNPTTPRFIHIPVISGPYAWNFVAIFWCGAAAANAHTLGARIVANIFVWGILGIGMFFLAVYKDYTMGFALSILTAALGVSQFLTKIVAFQWIFAFTIMAVLFVVSMAVGVPGLLGRDPFKRGEIVSEDRERAPLLADD